MTPTATPLHRPPTAPTRPGYPANRPTTPTPPPTRPPTPSYHDRSSCSLSFGGPSFCEELATSLNDSSYTHADPDASRNYYWVVACNSFGCSGIDPNPANQRYEYDGSAIVLSWDASADRHRLLRDFFASYTVYYTHDDFFGSSCSLAGRPRQPALRQPELLRGVALATSLNDSSYTHADPDASRNYYWVVACNSFGCSGIDSANPAQLGGSPPDAPANQRYEYDGSAIVLSWDASADAASYTVYYHDFFGSSCSLSFGSPSFCEELATSLNDSTYTHADPDASRNYYWVVACNSFGCSEIDSANPARLAGAPPDAPANQRYEHDLSGIVSWDASAGAASYTVY